MSLAGRFKRCNPELCLGEGINRRPKENNRRYFSYFTLLKANLDLQLRNRLPLRDFQENCYGPSASSSRRIRYALILGLVAIPWMV